MIVDKNEILKLDIDIHFMLMIAGQRKCRKRVDYLEIKLDKNALYSFSVSIKIAAKINVVCNL